MPGPKRPFECTVDEALNDFCYDPEITPTNQNKRRKRVYEPVPLDLSQNDTTAGLLLFPPSLDTPDAINHDIEDDAGPLPVKNKTQNDYLEEYKDHRAIILRLVTAREAPPQTRQCSICKSTDASNPMKWRCDDCFGSPVFCGRCLRTSHIVLPFHRVSHWDGHCFHRSSLNKAGITLNLGHCGALCPSYASDDSVPTDDVPSESSLLTSEPLRRDMHNTPTDDEHTSNNAGDLPDDDDDDEADEADALWQNVETGGVPLKGTRKAKHRLDSKQCPILTIVDVTGIHELRTRFCQCLSLETNPLSHQLLSIGLFPSSLKNPRTAFTFRVLDDINLTNLEGKISTFKYFKKLRRLTSNAFPHMITDRYRELLRVLRQWRDMQSRQRAGEAYSAEGESLTDGGLALFCAACPQPGINLPENWEADPEQWKYMRTLVADGNFKQDHLAMKNDHDDVALSDGLSYMVSRKRFDDYINSVPARSKHRTPTTSTCHEHRAVTQQNHAQAHLDITGIGCIACGRHGCFYPHCVVNFRKGEGQRYIDFAFVHAINSIPRSPSVLLLYDIMCQYWKYFKRRIKEMAGFLSLPNGMKMKKGIGLFHVHGHVKECFARYAPTFITGAGMLDGEVVETLWNPLNHTSSSARAMTWHHRQEYLDTHMADSNWLKVTGLVSATYRKWKKAIQESQQAEEDFQSICDAVGPADTSAWTALEKRLQKERSKDIQVMDQFDTTDKQELGLSAATTVWIRKEQEELHVPNGCASWIASGLRIVEEQTELAKLTRKLKKKSSDTEALYERRERLQESIDEFCRLARIYIPSVDHDQSIQADDPDEWEDFNPQSSEDEGEGIQHKNPPEVLDVLPAEEQKIPLPSSYGREACAGYLKFLAGVELALRIAQATDALHSLRLLIAQKSFVYRNDVRKGATNANHKKRLRSRGNIASLSASVDLSAKVYMLARRAMQILGAGEDILRKYQVLQPQHIQTSTAVVDFNAPGQRNKTLSWIWHSHQSSANDPSWLRELYRVNWLRAKSRRDRWSEEVVLLESELTWTRLYFRHRIQMWKERLGSCEDGLAYYARKQIKTWSLFESHAENALALIPTKADSGSDMEEG